MRVRHQLRTDRQISKPNEGSPAVPPSSFLLALAQRFKGVLPKKRNTDLQSVRPAEFYSAESNTPDRMSGGRTGHSPVFRFGNTPFNAGQFSGGWGTRQVLTSKECRLVLLLKIIRFDQSGARPTIHATDDSRVIPGSKVRENS